MSEIFSNVTLSIVASVLVAAIAVFVQFLAQRQRVLAKKSDETARSIAVMVQRREAERRAHLIENIVAKIPEGMTAEEFLASLEPVAAKLASVASVTPAEASAVESLVSSYHEQALDQAKIQFWFSVVAATIGFVWILYTGSQIEPKDLV
jgi:hypothetical protein